MKDAADTFPPEPRGPINYEQLEAEARDGFSVACNLDVSVTTLAHVVMACQYALKAPTINAAAAAILRDFARDAEARTGFPPNLAKLIAAGWA
jgi:hypothetical protein